MRIAPPSAPDDVPFTPGGAELAFTSTTFQLARAEPGFMASAAGSPPGSAPANWQVVDVHASLSPPGVNGTSSGAEGGAILIVSPGNWSRNIVTTAST